MRAHPALEAVRAVANNSKVFFGDKLPNIFIDPSVQGSPQFTSARYTKELAPLPSTTRGTLAQGFGWEGSAVLPLPRAAVISTGSRVRLEPAIRARQRDGGR